MTQLDSPAGTKAQCIWCGESVPESSGVDDSVLCGPCMPVALAEVQRRLAEAERSSAAARTTGSSAWFHRVRNESR